MQSQGAWVAQSVKRPTSSGHDLIVCEFEPRVRLCADSLESGACFGFCVSLSLSLRLPHSRSVSLSPSHQYFVKVVRESLGHPDLPGLGVRADLKRGGLGCTALPFGLEATCSVSTSRDPSVTPWGPLVSKPISLRVKDSSGLALGQRNKATQMEGTSRNIPAVLSPRGT